MPNWAATALNEESQAHPDEREEQAEEAEKDEEEATALKQSQQRGTLSTQPPGNYAKQNAPERIDSRAGGGQQRRPTASPSVTDQPAGLDDDIGQVSAGNDGEAPPKTAFSVYSSDSMEDGSLDGNEDFDALDSLERARSETGGEETKNFTIAAGLPSTKDEQHMESVIYPEESSILERTRDKMRIPKLIPVENGVITRQKDGELEGDAAESGQEEEIVSGELKNQGKICKQNCWASFIHQFDVILRRYVHTLRVDSFHVTFLL